MAENSIHLQSGFLDLIFMEGVEELIGHSGLNAVTDQILSLGNAIKNEPWPSKSGLLMEALENIYGQRGGCGVALRAGRASYKYLLRQFGGPLGLTSLDYRLQPAPQRLRNGLMLLAGLVGQAGNQKVNLEEADGAWFWRVEHCELCGHRTASEVVCTFFTGLLQEFLSWASGGKFYAVHEIECYACGAKGCVFRIDQKPLD